MNLCGYGYGYGYGYDSDPDVYSKHCGSSALSYAAVGMDHFVRPKPQTHAASRKPDIHARQNMVRLAGQDKLDPGKDVDYAAAIQDS